MDRRISLHPVQSSMMQAVGYDPDRWVLEILFSNGRARQYDGVPEDVYRGLCEASSPGSYFMRHIRHRYEHRSVHRFSL